MLTVRREQFRYMKNKYLTRFLCLTLMSGMVLSGPASVLAAEDTAAYTADGSDFSDSGDFDSGSEDPAPADPTPAEPTPAPVDPTPADPTPAPVDPTPTPAEPTPAPADPTPTPTDPTPTPANPTPTPSSQITKAAQDVIDRIKELNAQTITLEKKATVQSIALHIMPCLIQRRHRFLIIICWFRQKRLLLSWKRRRTMRIRIIHLRVIPVLHRPELRYIMRPISTQVRISIWTA